MATATGAQVRAITGSILNDTALEPFLSASGCVLGGLASCLAAKGVSSDCQDQAANFLAAHLMSVSGVGENSRIKKSESFENYSVEWAQSQLQGQGVKSTNYGQTANMLTMGCLSEADKSPALICSFG